MDAPHSYYVVCDSNKKCVPDGPGWLGIRDYINDVEHIILSDCQKTKAAQLCRASCQKVSLDPADILQHLTAEDIAKLLPEQTSQKTIAEIISELNTELDKTDGTKENKDISEFRKTVGKAINGMDFTKFYDPNWIVK